MTRQDQRPDRFITVAILAIAAVTVAWWAAALTPLPVGTPEWVIRARAACFGSTATGLPNSGGWILLIGTPLTMIAALFIIAPAESLGSFRSMLRSRRGTWILTATALTLLMLIGAAGQRVARLYGVGAETGVTAEEQRTVRDLEGVAPGLPLTDQAGRGFELAEYRGRPVLVTFAYGKCETVCPVVVHNVVEAATRLTAWEPGVVIVTLDPWRDTPPRLPHIAESWGLPPDARVLGGPIAEVEATLDAWNVSRARDPRTGEIAHAALLYVIDGQGNMAFATTGGAAEIEEAVMRLPLPGTLTGGQGGP